LYKDDKKIRKHKKIMLINILPTHDLPVRTEAGRKSTTRCTYLLTIACTLAYFPGIARVFIYPNLIVICLPSSAEIAHLKGIFSIITSTLLGGTLPTRRLIYILLHLRTNHSVEYPTVNSFTFHVTR
jgi:hypothetical protein